jgi:pre-mRNA-splicing factor 38B
MCLLLDHKDSPYIRCIGFLYLRYACEPNELWKWIQPYLFDEELVRVRFNPASAEIPIGEYVRKLFGDLEYFGTRLPRLPLLVERDLKAKLQQADLVEERAKRHFANTRTMDYFCTLGSRVRAQYEDEQNPLTWYDAVIDRVLTADPETNAALRRPKFVVTFPEYGNTEIVTLGDLDMPGDGETDRNRRWDDRRGHEFHRKDRARGEHEHDQYRAKLDDDRGRGGYSRGYDDRRERSRSREPEQDLGDRRWRRDEVVLSANYSGPGNNRKRAHDDGVTERSRPLAHIPRQEDIDAPPATKSIEKTPNELAAIAEKKRRLANRYG